MIKIKIDEKKDYILTEQKGKQVSVLEGIVLLDTTISMLRDDFDLSNDDIWELLKDYRSNLKKVK